jgi:hypothetical protein
MATMSAFSAITRRPSARVPAGDVAVDAALFRPEGHAAPSSSSRTSRGTIGSAMSCECEWSSEAPAAIPWFLKMTM